MKAADVEDGDRPGVTREEPDQVRELTKRNRLLEQGPIRVSVAMTCRVLGFSGSPVRPTTRRSLPHLHDFADRLRHWIAHVAAEDSLARRS